MNKRFVLSLTVASLVLGGAFVSSNAIAQDNSAPVVDEAAASTPAADHSKKAKKGKKKGHGKKGHKKGHGKKHAGKDDAKKDDTTATPTSN